MFWKTTVLMSARHSLKEITEKFESGDGHGRGHDSHSGHRRLSSEVECCVTLGTFGVLLLWLVFFGWNRERRAVDWYWRCDAVDVFTIVGRCVGTDDCVVDGHSCGQRKLLR